MDAANVSETLVLIYVYYATWHLVAEDCTVHPVYVHWHHFSSSIDCSAKDVCVVTEYDFCSYFY